MECQYTEPAESEKDYRRLSELASELGIPVIEPFLTLRQTLNGKVITNWMRRSHSWTRIYYNTLIEGCAQKNPNGGTWGDGYINHKDTGGTVRWAAAGASLTTRLEA
ncbi:MAG: hypothetical protein ACWGQW_00355 [bacterium]